MAVYLRGELRGQAAEVANEIGTMMRRKQDAFETRVTGELDVAKDERQRILDKLDVLVSLVTTLTEGITADHQKLVDFERWRERWGRRHCETCLFESDTATAQEG
jgi:predicted RecB family nuclease